MTETTNLFHPGAIVSTPGALRALVKAQTNGLDLVARHLRGDVGVTGAEDREQNHLAIECGARVISSYLLPTQVTLWVITEADRSATTLLLPDEY